MKTSAGLLAYRLAEGQILVLAGHPGGPYWAARDEGVWSIPKGEYGPDEDPLQVARREFAEETGHDRFPSEFIPLGEVTQRNRKVVVAWAVELYLDPDTATSNTFEMEWPPHSGRLQEFPEIDRVGWFTPEEARRKLNPAQAEFVTRLEDVLSIGD